MALLFIKQKLFPSQDGRKKSSNGYGKPLLSPVDDDSTLRGDSPDIEAQSPRAYETFGGGFAPHDEDEDDASSTSSSRSRINPRIVSDSILGLSDGLTVPFALSAGLSALGNTKVVVLGGLAELAAGAISMGLGGYVGAASEAESYEATVREASELIETSPAETSTIVHDIFASLGLTEEAISQINASLHGSHARLLDFLITFHHRESAPDCNQAWISALTLAIGYFVGGFIPLVPYFLADHVIVALNWSIGVMAITLCAFGYVKTCIVRGWRGSDNIMAGIKGGVQMCFVGGVAAGAAIGLVRVIDGGNH